MTKANRMVCNYLVALLFIVLPMLSSAQDVTASSTAKSVFHPPEELSEDASSLNRYLVLEPLLSNADEVKGLASLFGLDAEVEMRKRQYLVKEGERTLEVFRQPGTGYIRFSNDAELGAEKAPSNLPWPDEAAELAKEFLSEHGLLPESARLLGTRYSEFTELDGAGQIVRSGNSSITVIFNFEIDGKVVRGPGAKAGVVFGEGGKIIGASLIWRQIKLDDEAEIIAPKEAFQRFKNIWPPEDNEAADIQTDVFIDKVEATYYAKPGMYPMEFLEPVYAFSGFYELRGKLNGQVLHEKERFEVLVPAAEKSEALTISTWGPQREIR